MSELHRSVEDLAAAQIMRDPRIDDITDQCALIAVKGFIDQTHFQSVSGIQALFGQLQRVQKTAKVQSAL